MYRTIHRIEQVVKNERQVIEPNSVIDNIDNAEALLAAGAIVEFNPPEVTITTKDKPARKSKGKGDADGEAEFG